MGSCANSNMSSCATSAYQGYLLVRGYLNLGNLGCGWNGHDDLKTLQDGHHQTGFMLFFLFSSHTDFRHALILDWKWGDRHDISFHGDLLSFIAGSTKHKKLWSMYLWGYVLESKCLSARLEYEHSPHSSTDLKLLQNGMSAMFEWHVILRVVLEVPSQTR